MRRIEKSWQAAVKEVEVVQLNTLAKASMVPARGSRVGIVLSALPRYDGSVSVYVAHRMSKRRWTKSNFMLSSNAHTLSTLQGLLRERVMRSWNAHAGMEQIQSIRSGFCGQLGADPEIFAVKANAEVLPAWEFLPEKSPDTEIFWDGFQAEFTTTTETCLAWFIDHVRDGLRRVHKAAKKNGGQLALADVIEIPLEMLEKGEQKHVQFGCDPSKNAYNDHGQLEADPRKLQIRFAGGHMHFGMGLREVEAIRMVKALDAIWGVASVSLFAGLEHPLRRVYYGKAGEYRLPSHGLEYRTPSNAWLCHPAIAQLSWSLARQAVQIGQKDLLSAWKADEDETRRIINELDVTTARKILKKNQKVLETLLVGYFGNNNGRQSEAQFEKLSPLAIEYGLKVIMEGATTVLESPKDLVRNWMLEAPTGDDKWANPNDDQRHENRWILHSETGDKQWLMAAGTLAEGRKI
jgi:hypothetical protein